MDRTFDIYQCKECKAAFTDPFLTQEEYEDFHANHQVAFNGAGDEDALDAYEQNKATMWEGMGLHKRKNEISRLHPQAKRILDIGCGAGIFLDYMRDGGYEVEGMEISPWGYTNAKKRFGLTVHTDLIENLDPPEQAFDAITLYDVLEHTTDPLAFLDNLKPWLNKGGIVVINLPNFDSFLSKVSGKYWVKLTPPDHTFHFSLKALQNLLDLASYRLVEASTNHGDPAEFMQQLAVSTWRIPAKFSRSARYGLEHMNKPYENHKKKSVAAVKATKRVGQKLAPIGKIAAPLTSRMHAGEGLHVVVTPA